MWSAFVVAIRVLTGAVMRTGISFALFSVTGVVGFVIDAGVMSALVGLAGWGPIASRAVSFPLAVTGTWYMNRNLAFRNRSPDRSTFEYAGYVSTQVVGAAINVGVFAFCLRAWPSLSARPVVPLAIGAIVALIFNFLMLRALVYRHKEF